MFTRKAIGLFVIGLLFTGIARAEEMDGYCAPQSPNPKDRVGCVVANRSQCEEELDRLQAENAKLVTEVVRLRAKEYERIKKLKESRRRGTLRETNQSLREIEQLRNSGRRLIK